MSVFWLKCFKTIINYLKEIKEIKYVKIELNLDIHVLCKKKKKAGFLSECNFNTKSLK